MNEQECSSNITIPSSKKSKNCENKMKVFQIMSTNNYSQSEKLSIQSTFKTGKAVHAVSFRVSSSVERSMHVNLAKTRTNALSPFLHVKWTFIARLCYTARRGLTTAD